MALLWSLQRQIQEGSEAVFGERADILHASTMIRLFQTVPGSFFNRSVYSQAVCVYIYIYIYIFTYTYIYACACM